MTPDEFSKAALSKDMPNFDYSPIIQRFQSDPTLLRLVHSGIGMSGEAGEILDQLKKSMMYGKALDRDSLIEECGDVLWYMAVMLDTLGSSFGEVMQSNVTKLNKRYPSGFTETDALSRKDKT